MSKVVKNATFYAFKESGKYYSTGRGFLSSLVFSNYFSARERHHQILRDNDGKYPGLSGSGDGFILVIIGDENLSFCWPLLINTLDQGPK
jgi:hypothetical protein